MDYNGTEYKEDEAAVSADERYPGTPYYASGSYEYASARGIIKSADITPGLEGYTALAKDFGIIGGNPDSIFAPKDPLTRADAAIMVYNYLTK